MAMASVLVLMRAVWRWRDPEACCEVLWSRSIGTPRPLIHATMLLCWRFRAPLVFPTRNDSGSYPWVSPSGLLRGGDASTMALATSISINVRSLSLLAADSTAHPRSHRQHTPRRIFRIHNPAAPSLPDSLALVRTVSW